MKKNIEYLKKLTKPPLREEWDFAYKLDKRTAQAIENLIKGYRELEECLEVTSKSLNNVAYDQIPIAIQDLIVNSIPKSKIKEKIEEYKKLIKDVQDNEEHCHEIPLYEYDIELLQELLEEE